MLECYAIDNGIPLKVLSIDELPTWVNSQSQNTQQWVKNTGFSNKTEGFLLIPSENNQIAQVIVLCKDINDYWALGSLSKILPPSNYALDKDIPPKTLQQMCIAWGLGAYQFNRYKQSDNQIARLIIPGNCNAQFIQEWVSSIYFVRDLINTPAADMNPTELGNIADKLARQSSAQIQHIIGEKLVEKNYPAIHAVGRAAHEAPRLIDLRWGNPQDPKITLVGKGVCFDTGGLDLKSCNNMALMKKDMGGAAHVLGLAQLIMANELPISLRVLIPAVENAISANAYRPGDVIHTRKGLTVEIGNTDAEGRVILADALTEAASEKPDLIIDFATLTGAARVALGTDIPAFFTNNDMLAKQLEECAQQEQDPLWRLPLYQPYRSLLDSNIADINNAGQGGYAGAITAALFLKEFVPDDIPWMHIDLMAWNLCARSGRPEGGEAMGLRAVYRLLQENKF